MSALQSAEPDLLGVAGVAGVGPAASAVPATPALPLAAPPSYREILASSAVIGSSAVINLAVGVVRTKVMALLLGPAGFGLMGAYTLIAELTRSVAQLGVNASGVREIADAAASRDPDRIARTAAVLSRLSIGCALLGAALLALLAGPIARLTFGNADHTQAIALLGLAVFFSIIAGGQGALLQGLRRIGDMARLAVLGSVLGTLVGLPLVWALGADGLVPTLIVVAASSVVSARWFTRRLALRPPALTAAEVAAESTVMLKLGLAFMTSGLLTMGAAYAVRTLVVRQLGLEAAGIYYAAWTLGGLYIGFVLQALGTDFYPRLVGVAADDAETNRLVNEQTQVSLLLAVPGVLLTLTFAPLALSLLYSASFEPAAAVLRWICLGMALRVVTWPLGYIVVARRRQWLFFSIELSWCVVSVGLSAWCLKAFGLDGTGIAFFGSYVFHALVVVPAARRLSGFRWSRPNLLAGVAGCGVIGAVFAGFQWLPTASATALGALATLASAGISMRRIVRLAQPPRLPRSLAWLLRSGGRSA